MQQHFAPTLSNHAMLQEGLCPSKYEGLQSSTWQRCSHLLDPCSRLACTSLQQQQCSHNQANQAIVKLQRSNRHPATQRHLRLGLSLGRRLMPIQPWLALRAPQCVRSCTHTCCALLVNCTCKAQHGPHAQQLWEDVARRTTQNLAAVSPETDICNTRKTNSTYATTELLNQHSYMYTAILPAAPSQPE